jgi:hypothetical protein
MGTWADMPMRLALTAHAAFDCPFAVADTRPRVAQPSFVMSVTVHVGSPDGCPEMREPFFFMRLHSFHYDVIYPDGDKWKSFVAPVHM